MFAQVKVCVKKICFTSSLKLLLIIERSPWYLRKSVSILCMFLYHTHLYELFVYFVCIMFIISWMRLALAVEFESEYTRLEIPSDLAIKIFPSNEISLPFQILYLFFIFDIFKSKFSILHCCSLYPSSTPKLLKLVSQTAGLCKVYFSHPPSTKPNQ